MTPASFATSRIELFAQPFCRNSEAAHCKMRSLEFGAFVFACFVARFDCIGDFVFACFDARSDCDGDFICAFFFSRSGFVSFAFISIVSNANMFLSLCQCFAFQHVWCFNTQTIGFPSFRPIRRPLLSIGSFLNFPL